jgi:hypothetical protein
MKRMPLMLTLATAGFLTLCVVEIEARGLNPPLDWDLHPAWWQSDLLATLGWWITMPSLYVSGFTDSHFSQSQTLARAAFALSLILTVMFASLLVFYLTRISVRKRKA